MCGITDHYRIEEELEKLGFFDGDTNSPAHGVMSSDNYSTLQVWVPYMPATTIFITTILIRESGE